MVRVSLQEVNGNREHVMFQEAMEVQLNSVCVVRQDQLITFLVYNSESKLFKLVKLFFFFFFFVEG